MTDREQHQMILERTHASGAQEWHCPTCDRRFLMQWEPKFKRVILNEGNVHAAHSGGTGGLQVSPPQVEPILTADLRSALEEALEDIDFGDWAAAA
ncbi:MAG: hypothetical protein D6768_01895 [Chloroflexi bacterium]|nr:MAG: hypothetical protein D6768_01895 [Chloroflexota bacterium]